MKPAQAVTLEAFQELLRTGNLLEIHELARVVADITREEFGTAHDFARWLVERKWITRWQAQMMLAGSNRFFLGKYKLLERVGAGGMGTVFKAQQKGLGRIVALKVMSDALLGDEQAVARFHREIRSAAALEHPHIVATFDADCVGGKHFLVMEYVDGDNLQALAKQRGRLPMEEACEYIRQAALGLAHAHERGMIHRDIKPANLLVAFPASSPLAADNAPLSSDPPAAPLVKILDFGLARLANEAHGDTALTQTGQIMGTADYIAPEQARDTKAADIRSDIYSLGCTLFRLLAGEVPFKGKSVMEKLMARALEEAPRVRTLCPELPAELDECIARMVARDPAARLQTPDEVAAALAIFAAPGIAPTFRREPIPALGIPVSGKGFETSGDIDPGLEEFLAVLATDASGTSGRPELADDTSPTGQGSGTGGSTRVNTPFRRAPKTPGAGQHPSSSNQNLVVKRGLRFTVAAAVPAAVLAIVAAGLLWYRSGTTWIEIDWPENERKGATLEIDGREPILSGRLAFPGRSGRRTLRLQRKGYEPIEEEWQLGRGETIQYRPEWKLTPLAARRREATALKSEVERFTAAFGEGISRRRSPESDALREKCSDFILRWLNTSEAAQVASARRGIPAPVDELNRQRVPARELRAAGGGNPADAPPDLVAVIGDSRLKHGGRITKVAFSPDDAWVAVGDDAGIVKIWNVAAGEEVHTIRAHTHGVSDLAFSPEGTVLITGSYDWSARLWDLESFEERHNLPGHQEQVRAVAYSPLGNVVATGGLDKQVKLWNPADGTLIRTIAEGIGQVASLAFSPDGRTLAVGCYEPFPALVLNVPDGTRLHNFTAHEHPIYSFSFSPDGGTLATGDHENVIRFWDATTGEEVAPASKRFETGLVSIGYCADGKVLVAADGQGHVILQDPRTGEQEETPLRHPGGITAMALSHRGRRLATGGHDWNVKISDIATGKVAPIVGPRIHCLAVSPDGQWLALGISDGDVELWDVAAGKTHNLLRGHPQRVAALAFSPDGRLLATGGYHGDPTIRIWDVASQTKLTVIDAQSAAISALIFSPDARWLASTGHDSLVKLWDVETGGLEKSHDGKAGSVFGLAYNADGRTLAAAYNPHERKSVVKFWGSADEPKTLTLDGMWGNLASIAFGQDDKSLTIGHPQNGVRFWNLTKGIEYGRLSGTGVFAFNADASWLALDTTSGIELYEPPFNAPSTRLAPGGEGRQVLQFVFTPEGRHLAVLSNNGTLQIRRLPVLRD